MLQKRESRVVLGHSSWGTCEALAHDLEPMLLQILHNLLELFAGPRLLYCRAVPCQLVLVPVISASGRVQPVFRDLEVERGVRPGPVLNQTRAIRLDRALVGGEADVAVRPKRVYNAGEFLDQLAK